MTEFARQVLDALPLTIYTTDLAGNITSANRSWSQFAQDNGAPKLASEQSVCGSSLWNAFADPGYTKQVRSAMDTLLEGRVNKVAWEFPCSSPTEERVFLMQITALRDAGHHVTGFVFSTVDITPSHRSREALIDTGLALARPIELGRVFFEVGHQLRRAMSTELFAVWLSPAEGSEAELVFSLADDGDTTGIEAKYGALAREAMVDGKLLLIEEGTSVRIVAPMSAGSDCIGTMLLLSDGLNTRQDREEAQRVVATLAAQAGAAIERVRLVQRVAHKQRLEAVGEVATGVAHELRNPLFGISSAAQLLRFRAREDVVVERNVGRILREVERLSRMVTSLLEFGRPKPIALVLGDPDVVWDEVLEGQKGLLEARALAVRYTRPVQPMRLLIDPEQLAQVFLNLLVNAADHAPPATDIYMDSVQLPGGGWRFRIQNGGPAIPADVLARVFEMFYSTKPGGTGIGLALCQRIVEEHGGRISIDSAPETGTTVTITLPAAP